MTLNHYCMGSRLLMAEKWLNMTEKMTNPDLIDYLIIDSAIPSIIIINYCTKLILARPIQWPLFVLGRKRPILYVALVELPPSIAIVMYGK